VVISCCKSLRGTFGAVLTAFVLLFVAGAPIRASDIQSLNSDSQGLSEINLILYGVVDRVQVSTGNIELFGQTLELPRNEIGQINEEMVGKVVAVFGHVNFDGTYSVSAVTQIASTDFVPGATRLLLTGRITMIDRNYAVAKIGSQTIAFADALYALNSESLNVGDIVSFGGVQYSGDAKLYADDGSVRNFRPDI